MDRAKRRVRFRLDNRLYCQHDDCLESTDHFATFGELVRHMKSAHRFKRGRSHGRYGGRAW